MFVPKHAVLGSVHCEIGSILFTCPEAVLLQGPGRDLGAVVNVQLLSVLQSVAKLSEQRGEDVGAGAAAAAASLLEAACVIGCLQSAVQAGACLLSHFHLPHYFPSKAGGARQLLSGLTAAKLL